MTGLLTGTNKFKKFEIETSLKISVLNSPYLEGRRYVYEDTNSSPVLSNYKIYNAAEWSGTDKQKVDLEEGFYVFAKGDGSTNAGAIYKLSKDNGNFSIHRVVSKVDSSTNTPTEIQLLMDYTNPNSIETFSTETPPLDDVFLPNIDEISTSISKITGLYPQEGDLIVEQNPNLIGCIITVLVGTHF